MLRGPSLAALGLRPCAGFSNKRQRVMKAMSVSSAVTRTSSNGGIPDRNSAHTILRVLIASAAVSRRRAFDLNTLAISSS
eukprot:7391829-Prymnesium_polylepis.1